MLKEKNVTRFAILLCTATIFFLASCRTPRGQNADTESALGDVRYGLKSGVFTRIFAKNVCSCLFVSGFKNPNFSIPYCNEQAAFYVPINILGRRIAGELSWLTTIRANTWPEVGYKNGTDPIYVIAKGRTVGIAKFDPKYPHLGCSLVSETSTDLPKEIRQDPS